MKINGEILELAFMKLIIIQQNQNDMKDGNLLYIFAVASNAFILHEGYSGIVCGGNCCCCLLEFKCDQKKAHRTLLACECSLLRLCVHRIHDCTKLNHCEVDGWGRLSVYACE